MRRRWGGAPFPPALGARGRRLATAGLLLLAVLAGVVLSRQQRAEIMVVTTEGSMLGQRVSLSELPWLEATTGWLGVANQQVPQKDRSFAYRPLRLAGREFAHGIGTYPFSEITYRLDGAYSQFSAWAGVDDATVTTRARARFLVYVDDVLRFESALLRAGDELARIDVPLNGARSLRLVVADEGGIGGAGGDSRLYVDWAEAELLRPIVGQATFDEEWDERVRADRARRAGLAAEDARELDAMARRVLEPLDLWAPAGAGERVRVVEDTAAGWIALTNADVALLVGVSGDWRGKNSLLDRRRRRLVLDRTSPEILPGGGAGLRLDRDAVAARWREAADEREPFGRGRRLTVEYDLPGGVTATLRASLFDGRSYALWQLGLSGGGGSGSTRFRLLRADAGAVVAGVGPHYVTDFSKRSPRRRPRRRAATPGKHRPGQAVLRLERVGRPRGALRRARGDARADAGRDPTAAGIGARRVGAFDGGAGRVDPAGRRPVTGGARRRPADGGRPGVARRVPADHGRAAPAGAAAVVGALPVDQLVRLPHRLQRGRDPRPDRLFRREPVRSGAVAHPARRRLVRRRGARGGRVAQRRRGEVPGWHARAGRLRARARRRRGGILLGALPRQPVPARRLAGAARDHRAAPRLADRAGDGRQPGELRLRFRQSRGAGVLVGGRGGPAGSLRHGRDQDRRAGQRGRGAAVGGERRLLRPSRGRGAAGDGPVSVLPRRGDASQARRVHPGRLADADVRRAVFARFLVRRRGAVVLQPLSLPGAATEDRLRDDSAATAGAAAADGQPVRPAERLGDQPAVGRRRAGAGNAGVDELGPDGDDRRVARRLPPTAGALPPSRGGAALRPRALSRLFRDDRRRHDLSRPGESGDRSADGGAALRRAGDESRGDLHTVRRGVGRVRAGARRPRSRARAGVVPPVHPAARAGGALEEQLVPSGERGGGGSRCR